MTEADYRQQEELEQERRERTIKSIDLLWSGAALFALTQNNHQRALNDKDDIDKAAAFLAGELGLSKEWENR